MHLNPVIVSAIAGAAAVTLGVGGWITYTTIQLNDARAAYEAAIVDLETARSDAEAEADAMAAATQTLERDLTVAEQLVALLGEGSETLLAAADGTRATRESVEGYRAPAAPARSAGALPENPGLDDYVTLRDAVEALTATWSTYGGTLADVAAGVAADHDALIALWQAQRDTAANTAAAAINTNPNASQEAKDAATAAAAALTEPASPLDADAVERWTALLTANSTLAAQEQAYQEQQAAEAEAARRAAQSSRGSTSGGSSGSGTSSGGGGTDYLAQLRAAVARDAGVDVSAVNCFDIPNGVRCEWNTPERTGSRTFTIG